MDFAMANLDLVLSACYETGNRKNIKKLICRGVLTLFIDISIEGVLVTGVMILKCKSVLIMRPSVSSESL